MKIDMLDKISKIILKKNRLKGPKNNCIDNFNLIETIDNTKNIQKINIEKLNEEENGKKALKDFKTLLNTLEFKRIDISETIISDNETYIEKQHEILGTHYIFLNIENKNLRIVTEDGKAFIIDTEKVDDKIYGTIFTTYMPRKICIDSSSIFNFNSLEKNSIYDIVHIVRMFYNIENPTLSDIINMFIKKPIENEDINIMAYNLFPIKNEINTLLEKHLLMKMINKETKLLEIIAKCQKKGLPFSKEKFIEFKNFLEDKYNEITNEFKEKYNKELEEIFDIISMCNDNGEYTSVNKEFLKEIGNIKLAGEVLAFKVFEKYKNAKLNYNDNRLFLNYNPYNKYGNIECSFDVDNKYIVTDNNIAIGKYPDLYYRIFAEIVNVDYIIEAINSNKLIEALTERIFGEVNPPTKLNTKCVLDGFINGYFDEIEMAEFILDERDTYIDEQDVKKIQNEFREKCPELIKTIENFNKFRSFDKRHPLEPRDSLHRYIKVIESDIFKQAVMLVYNNIINYNQKNKSQIYLVGLLDNKIVLEADDNSINVAVDILNRNLPKAFEKYIKKVQAVSVTYNSKKLQ